MKKIFQTLFVLGALLPTLFSCSQEAPIVPEHSANTGAKVVFTIQNGLPSTRAVPAPGVDLDNPPKFAALDREKKIDNLYAVVFKPGATAADKTLYNTFEVSVTQDPSTHVLTGEFDMLSAGSYVMTLVANADTELLSTLNGLVSGSATKADFDAIVVTHTPGEENEPDGFVMVSGETEVTSVSNGTAVVPDPIVLERLSARFDLYNTVDKLVMKSIRFESRYVESRLVRGSANTVMSGLSFNSTKEYTIPATTHRQYLAHIYGYENMETNTILHLTAEYNGLPVEKAIAIEGTPVKRNHLYRIVISSDKVLPGDVAGSLKADITVLDWEKTVELEWKDDNLTDYKNAPGKFTVSGTGVTSDLAENPTKVFATYNATTVTLTVTSNTASSKLMHSGILPDGWSYNKDATTTEYKDGKMVQTFEITLTENADTKKECEFKLHNAFNSMASVTFNLQQTGKKDRKKMALEYVAARNVAQDGTSFALSDNNDASGYWNWNDAVAKFKSVTIAGEAYHLPSREEWQGIFPYYNGNYMVYYGSNNSYNNNPEQITVNGVSKTYFGDYRNNASLGVTYALRFKKATSGGTSEFPAAADNEMLCAFRYERVGSFANNGNLDSHLKVTCRYLGTTFSGDVTTIAKEDFWTTNNGEDVTRIFPAVGYKDSSGTLHYRGYNAHFWSATENSSSNAYNVFFYSSDARSSTYSKPYRFTVRPFFDN